MRRRTAGAAGAVGGGGQDGDGDLGRLQRQAHRQPRALPQRGRQLRRRLRTRAVHLRQRLRLQRRQVHRLRACAWVRVGVWV